MAHHFEADSKILLLHEPHEKKKEGDCTVDITEENLNLKQKQVPGGKHISRVNSALTKTNQDAYKPKLISIGPYHMEDPGLEKGVKQDFQKSLFKKIDGFEEHSTKRLSELKDKARSWYTEDTQHMNDAQFVDMLLLDACFTLEFLEKLHKNEVTDDVFMKVSGKVVQTLTDMLLFENQLPFFVLFELFKLKKKKRGCTSSGSDHHPKNDNENDDDADLLQDLITLVKRHLGSQAPKFTPQNVVPHEYKAPDVLPKHLIQVVHSLCIPRNAKCPRDVCYSDGMIEQINTATELQDDGIGFMKIGNVYEGYFDNEGPNFNANDGTTMFDLDFSNGILKIPSFMIQDNTETFLRNMIAYEQHSTDAPMCFTDFACFMDELIESTADVNLLRRRGIIINWLATDDMITKMFYNLCKDVISYNPFSQVIKKVNRHGDKAWNIWYGKLRHDLYFSPWKLISTVVGGLVVTLGTAVTLKDLLGY